MVLPTETRIWLLGGFQMPPGCGQLALRRDGERPPWRRIFFDGRKRLGRTAYCHTHVAHTATALAVAPQPPAPTPRPVGIGARSAQVF